MNNSAKTSARFSERRLLDISAAVAAEIGRGRIPGATMIIADAERTWLEQTLGVRDPRDGSPLAADAIFRIYSMTKPIVSLGLMMLVEQGRLLITDPVHRFLPELRRLSVGVCETASDGSQRLRLVPTERTITVQDLLRHTSGFTYGYFGDSLVKAEYRKSGVEARNISNEELVKTLGQLPLAYQPGCVWEYGRSTDVIGALIERLCDMPLDVFLEERILKPLDMRDSGFWVPPAEQHRIAEAYAVDPEGGVAVDLNDVRRPARFLSGGGGMVSTARDYLRFARMLLNQGSLDGVRLIGRKTLQFMTADHLVGLPAARSGDNYLPGPGYGFGLGFAVRTELGGAAMPGSRGDFTWSGLAGTYFWIDPVEGFTAIWLMQAPEQRAYFRQFFRNLVYAAVA